MTDLAATALRSGANGQGVPPLRLVGGHQNRSERRKARRSGFLTGCGNKSEPEVTAIGGNANARVSNSVPDAGGPNPVDACSSPVQRVVSRVEGWAVANGVNLGQPISKTTLRDIAHHAQASDAEALAAIEHLRQEQGVTVSLAPEAPADPGDAFDLEEADGGEEMAIVPPAPESVLSASQLRLYQELQARNVDLTLPVPGAVVDEIAPLLGVVPASIRSALQRIREKLGIECAPFAPPRPQPKTEAPPPAPAQSAPITLPTPTTCSATPAIPTEARDLAVFVVRELCTTTGPQRTDALMEAARLLRRTLR